MKATNKLFILPLVAGFIGLASLAPVSAQSYTYERSSTYTTPYTFHNYVDDPMLIDGTIVTPSPYLEDRVVTRPVYINDDYKRPLVINRQYYPRRGLHLDFPFGDIDLR